MASSKPGQLNHSPSTITLLTLPKIPLRSPSVAAPPDPAQLSWPIGASAAGAMPPKSQASVEPHFLALSARPTAPKLQRLPPLEHLNCAQQQTRPQQVHGAPQSSCAAPQAPVFHSLGLPPLQHSSSMQGLGTPLESSCASLSHCHTPTHHDALSRYPSPTSSHHQHPLLLQHQEQQEQQAERSQGSSGPIRPVPRAAKILPQPQAQGHSEGQPTLSLSVGGGRSATSMGSQLSVPLLPSPPPLQHSISQTQSTGSGSLQHTPTSVTHAHTNFGAAASTAMAAHPQQLQQQPQPFPSMAPQPRLLQQPLLSQVSAPHQHQPPQSLQAVGPLPRLLGMPMQTPRGSEAQSQPPGRGHEPLLAASPSAQAVPRAPVAAATGPCVGQPPQLARAQMDSCSEAWKVPECSPAASSAAESAMVSGAGNVAEDSVSKKAALKKGAPRKPPAVRLAVGTRMRILWPRDGRWHKAQVKKFDPKKALHTVFTDHGDSRRVDLRVCHWEPLSGEDAGAPFLLSGLAPAGPVGGIGVGMVGGEESEAGGGHGLDKEESESEGADGVGEDESAAGEEDAGAETGAGEGVGRGGGHWEQGFRRGTAVDAGRCGEWGPSPAGPQKRARVSMAGDREANTQVVSSGWQISSTATAGAPTEPPSCHAAPLQQAAPLMLLGSAATGHAFSTEEPARVAQVVPSIGTGFAASTGTGTGTGTGAGTTPGAGAAGNSLLRLPHGFFAVPPPNPPASNACARPATVERWLSLELGLQVGGTQAAGPLQADWKPEGDRTSQGVSLGPLALLAAGVEVEEGQPEAEAPGALQGTQHDGCSSSSSSRAQGASPGHVKESAAASEPVPWEKHGQAAQRGSTMLFGQPVGPRGSPDAREDLAENATKGPQEPRGGGKEEEEWSLVLAVARRLRRDRTASKTEQGADSGSPGTEDGEQLSRLKASPTVENSAQGPLDVGRPQCGQLLGAAHSPDSSDSPCDLLPELAGRDQLGVLGKRSSPPLPPSLEESQHAIASASVSGQDKAWATGGVYQRDFLSLGLCQEKCPV